MAMTTPPLSQLLADAPETFSLSELGGESWSAAQCAAHLAEVVESAAALGLSQGHRIGLLAPDAALTPLATLGLMERARVVPLNPALTPSELDTILKDAALDAVIVADGAPTGHRFTLPCLALRGVRLTGPALPPPPQDRADAAPGLLLLTSGSTGAPKRVYLTFDQLLHSARTIAATLGLSPQDRTLHALPMFHIGAVVDLFLAPLVSGGAVVVSADRSAAGLARGVREGGATWMQTVPTMLAQCLTHWSAEEAATLGAGLRCVRSVSSDLAPAMQAAAEAHLGGTPVIQMYGLTETAGQVASNPLPPAARKPGSVGQVNGAEVTITDANGSPLPAGAEGEICVRGPTVTSGYEGVPREAHFFGAWLRTGDMGRLDAEGFLTLTGRKKEMINRGGEKIAPVEVERAVLQVEGVAEAAAFALPHPSLGEQVGLAVVLRPGSGLDEAALIDAVKPHLAAFKQPRRIAVLPELPRLGSGKIDKLSLQAAQSETNLGPAHQTRTGLAAQVAPLWSAALQGPDPRDEDDFFDAGGDSLTAAEFLLALEAELGRTVTQTMLYDAPRFGAFVAALEAGVEGASASAPPAQERILQHVRQTTLGWPGRPSGAQGLLYGLHLLADGPPLFYCSQGENEGIIAMVGPSRPLYIMRTLFELPGRTPDETAELARLYAEDIMALQPDGPVHLAGFCEGGRLFEITARHLRAAGREIALFVSIDHWFDAPSPYPVLHAFTERRRMSPVRRFVRYERAFPYLHPGGVAQVRLKGDHADALTRHGLAPLKAALADAMAGAVPPKLPDPQGLPLARRAEQHSAAISIMAPGVLSRTAPRQVVVDVTNTSGAPWEPFETSGLALGVHFNNLDGFRRVPHALHLPLTTRVAPGQRHRFEVEIRYPDTGLPLYLTAQMIDEGFAEFGGPHRYGARRLVWANPLTARTWRD